MRLPLALLLMCAAPALAAGSPASQPAYPTKPIRVIILVVPGGGADITSRTVGQKLTESLAQQVIVDNRPGGNGIVGMEIAARSNPDGYTLVLGTIGPVAVNPSLYKKLPYDPMATSIPSRAPSPRSTCSSYILRCPRNRSEISLRTRNPIRESSRTDRRVSASRIISRASSSTRSPA